jgi:hypothetical protein
MRQLRFKFMFPDRSGFFGSGSQISLAMKKDTRSTVYSAFLKMAILFFTLGWSGRLSAQMSALFAYDRPRVDSIMQQIDEHSSSGETFHLIQADTTAEKLGGVVGAMLIGLFSGSVFSYGGCVLGFKVASDPMNGALVGLVAGSLISLVGTPLIADQISKHRLEAGAVVLGEVMGITPSVVGYWSTVQLVNEWNDFWAGFGCVSISHSLVPSLLMVRR